MKVIHLILVLVLGVSCAQPNGNLGTPVPSEVDSLDSSVTDEVGDAGQGARVGTGGDATIGTRESELDGWSGGDGLSDTSILTDALGVPDTLKDGEVSEAETSSSNDAEESPPCELPAGKQVGQSFQRNWGGEEVQSSLVNQDECLRTFVIESSATLLDGLPSNPRTIIELEGQPVLRTHNPLFDGLYALAIEEVRENSVEAVEDGAFNNGAPVACGEGGCFETGRKWKYVWTRDTAYAVDLALGGVDPLRSRNSLEFKLSPFRGGTDEEIVQDTGSGGSWPVSTDRVSWALGAWALLPHLDASEEIAFRERAFGALSNTLERDRQVAFDPKDGLYRGEQSFLDWREQSYPLWTQDTVVDIAMSKALSTNILHFRALQVASEWAAATGSPELQDKYGSWASALLEAIRNRFWLEEEGLFSSFITTELDPAPVRRFDLLGSSLAILHGIATEEQSLSLLQKYPHYGPGAPVIWPQQQNIPIYHNRGEWPFVTAYWLRAAAKMGHSALTTKMVEALVRGTAVNLSNMENFEASSGKAFLEDGPTSGPVVNSQRQLWSVAGYLSMVQHTLFGIRMDSDENEARLRLSPFVPESVRESWFPDMESILLENVNVGSQVVTVELMFPEASNDTTAYIGGGITLNGEVLLGESWPVSSLPSDAHFVVQLQPKEATTDENYTAVSDENYQMVFGPRAPIVTGLEDVDGGVQLQFELNNESPEDVAIHVYRDGVLVADLPGDATSWDDPSTPVLTEAGVCYAVEASFLVSGNRSQHSPPTCWWRADYSIIKTFGAPLFTASGGELINNHGRWHYQNWGDKGDSLVVPGIIPVRTGQHLLQVEYGNGAGPIDSGITCGLKWLTIEDEESGEVVGEGALIMPHAGDWTQWRNSNFIPVSLDGSRSYSVRIQHSQSASNMSALAHFENYTGGAGGESGAYFYVNISELKLLSR